MVSESKMERSGNDFRNIPLEQNHGIRLLYLPVIVGNCLPLDRLQFENFDFWTPFDYNLQQTKAIEYHTVSN